MTRLAAGVALAAVVAACGRNDGRRPLTDRVPRVERAETLAADTLHAPRYRVTVTAEGSVLLAEHTGWSERLTALGRRAPPGGPAVTLDDLLDQLYGRASEGSGVNGFNPRHPDDAQRLSPEYPIRLGQVIGEIFDDAGRSAQVVVLAAPAAKAGVLVDVLSVSGGILAVNHRGALRALRIEFGLHRFDPWSRGSTWMEIRVDRIGIEVEGVPDLPEHVPWTQGTVDADGLAAAIGEVSARRRLGRDPAIDVLVSADVGVQRLIDVLVALEAMGVRVVVLGRAPPPGSEEARRRGQRIIAVIMGQPQSVGDLDKSIIRSNIKARVPQIRSCYVDALARDSTLSGTVSTQFFIAPNGTVTASNAAGVEAGLAACVARVIKAMVFPKPKGGGGVQVNYPFTFRN